MSSETSATAAPLLEIRDLAVEYRTGRSRSALRAVDAVTFTVGRGETVGLVGESGSGKSTIGRAILGLASVTDGTILFDGHDITRAGFAERRRMSRVLQVVFQDPFSSFNPTRTVGQSLAEAVRTQGVPRAEADRRAGSMLERVGLPADARTRYPAAFSGGQRQRIAVARALMASPDLVVCDEVVSALDLSVQAQVINLLRSLQAELQLSYLFISHDLAVVRNIAHRIVVLYRGTIMETGPTSSVYRCPRHPYTQALLDAAPQPDPEVQRRRRTNRARSAPDPGPTPTDTVGCPFAPRCPHVIDLCRTQRPRPEATPEGSTVACHRWRDLDQGSTPMATSAFAR